MLNFNGSREGEPPAETDNKTVGVEKRRPGRPKGSRNKISRDAREILAEHGPDAVRMLCKLAAGHTVYGPVDPETGKRKKHVPSLDQSLVAARIIVDRLVPSLKAAEISGPDGAPVTFARTVEDMTDIERGRRMAFLLTQADRAIAAAKEQERDDDD